MENKSLSEKRIHGNKINYDLLTTRYWIKSTDVKEAVRKLMYNIWDSYKQNVELKREFERIEEEIKEIFGEKLI